MGSVAIREGNKLTYSKAVGWASVEDSICNTDTTKYRIGSVTKIFTAVMIYQFMEENAISKDTKLSRFYPRIPRSDSITIDHLLSHRSGIHNLTADADYMTYMTKGSSKEEILERIIEKGMDFPPGEKSDYSNSNYILLGYILEQLADTSYAALLQERICQPLGLQHTNYGDSTNVNNNESYSYRYTGKRWFQLSQTHMSIPHGAGAMVSTAEDLTAFIQALFSLRLVNRDALDQMMQIRDGIGRGMFEYTYNTDTAYGHGGGIDGFSTILFHYPTKDISIAVCSNGLNYRNRKVLNSIIDIYFGHPFEMPDFITHESLPDSLEMLAYAGEYTCDDHPLDIRLFIKNDQLYGQASGQSSFPLTWETKDILTMPAANIVIDFSASEKVDGKFSGFVFTQGKEFTFIRKE